MELVYDWRSFHRFFPQVLPLKAGGQGEEGAASAQQASASSAASASTIIFLLVSGNKVLAAWGGDAAIRAQRLATVPEWWAQYPRQRFQVLECAQVDRLLQQLLVLPNFVQQRQASEDWLLAQPLEKARWRRGGGGGSTCRQHFLLQFLQSRFQVFLPKQYGIFLCLTPYPGSIGFQCESGFFLWIQQGRVEKFFIPELDSLSLEKKKTPENVVRFLAQKYALPVQGLFVAEKHWKDWSAQPVSLLLWRAISRLLKKHPETLVPAQWRLRVLFAWSRLWA